MMTARRRRSFTPEFKAQTVGLLRTSGKSVGEVCRDLDLTETVVRRWLAQADIDTGRRDGLTTIEREELSRLRRENLETLRGFWLTSEDLGRRGLHPELGEVTLGQLLATWVVHDLDHLAQVARTMAKAYGEATGPWSEYLSILRDRQR